MTQQTNVTDIANKIQKLIALAQDGGATQAEAATATAKVSALLFAYNLSMADIEASTPTTTPKLPYIKDEMELGAVENGFSFELQKRLATTLSHHNFCRLIYTDHRARSNGRSKLYTVTLHFIGQEHNVVAVKYLYSFLSESFIRLAEYDYAKFTKGDRPHRGQFVGSWYRGAIDNIITRLQEQEQESAVQFNTDTTHTASSTALIVIKDKELDDAKAEFFPNIKRLTPWRFGHTNNRAAYKNGYDAADTLSLSNPLDAPEPRAQIR